MSITDGLSDSQTSDQVRFVVNGEPYELSEKVLLNYSETMFAVSASFAKTTNVRDKDGTTLVKLSGDPRAYRILFMYLSTGELILPPDALDRQVLLAVAGQCHLPLVVAQIMAATSVTPLKNSAKNGLDEKDSKEIIIEPIASSAVAPRISTVFSAAPVAPIAPPVVPVGFALPDVSVLMDQVLDVKPQVKNQVARSGLIIPTGWEFWRPSDGSAAPKDDIKMLADEYSARLKFGQDEDGTKFLNLVPLYQSGTKSVATGLPLLSGSGGLGYQSLTHPAQDGPTSMVYVQSFTEFSDQFDAISFGLISRLLRDLPIVAAGGSVLSALHRLPLKDVPTGARDKIAEKLSAVKIKNPFVDQSDAGAGLRQSRLTHSKFAQLYSANFTDGEESEEEVEEISLRAEIDKIKKTLLKQNQPTASAAAISTKDAEPLPIVKCKLARAGVGRGGRGKAPTRRRSPIRSVSPGVGQDTKDGQDIKDVKDEKDVLDDAFDDQNTIVDDKGGDKKRLALMTAARRLEWCQDGKLRRLFLRKENGALAQVPVRRCRSRRMGRNCRRRSGSGRHIPNAGDINGYIQVPIDESNWLSNEPERPTPITDTIDDEQVDQDNKSQNNSGGGSSDDNMGSDDEDMENDEDEKDVGIINENAEKDEKDEKNVYMIQKSLLAKRLLEKEEHDVRRRRILRSLLTTDIDLFLVTRDATAALKAMKELDLRIRRNMSVANLAKIRIMRTDHATTWIMPHPYRNIQVIHRLYYSMEHVLLGFDVDSCCLGYDGQRVVALPRAVRALKQRYNLVDVTRQSTTYESRLVKYAKRGFAIAVPGLDMMEEVKRLQPTLLAAERRNQYVSLTGLQQLLASLYAIHNKHALLKSMLRTVDSDYSDTINVARIIDRITVAERNNTTLPYAFGQKVSDVLSTNKCTVKISRGPTTYECLSTVPQLITFQLSRPHTQDRVDLLYTGSFQPTTLDWYGAKIATAQIFNS